MSRNGEAGAGVLEDTVETVAIALLKASDSPRLSGQSADHIRSLMCSEAEIPPIIVHRPTMKVIDGMHRLRAATQRGDRHIEVRFFDGDETAAFIFGVRSNIAHGLPLSQADRVAAAERIIRWHPRWSDRSIASSSGLSPKTVAATRRRMTPEDALAPVRIGRDGKVRPLDASEGRRHAGRLFAENSGASLREVAKAAGISVGTASDVRERLRRGEDPVAPRGEVRRENGTGAADSGNATEPRGLSGPRERDLAALLRILKKDPSLRFTESGRALLRLFDAQALCAERWDRLVGEAPPHCTPMIAELAEDCAKLWDDLARQLRLRSLNSARWTAVTPPSRLG
ncbi:ParB N-terminal domain-containing protein [Actinomadura vinacea]|uniref:ParB N-terminal domain-containing protein n=1 Tax=Actinomadura vinacea TaxID=115336 RepID=A0ABP5VN82_9ACTN